MRTRKNVWKLPAGDQTLAWYGKAVAAMLALPLANPRSWRYQAAIHGYPGADRDPLATPDDEPPADQDVYWDQCQHSSSFFLPWHRMYLLHFERIVAAQVAALGGPADWALPYWDYYKDPAWQLLPVAFRAPQLADGSSNPLYVAQRNAQANSGEPFLHARDVDVSKAMRAPGSTDATGFFGPPPANHNGGSAPFGQLESQPHNPIHVALGSDAIVGGQPVDGWMGDPDFAALDPMFWLHHANIDRLWDVWLKRDPTHHDLATPLWLSGVAFAFHDATGAKVTMKSEAVLDTTRPGLDYNYEDYSDPLAPAAVKARPLIVEPHELVGATTGTLELGEDVAHVPLPTPVTPQTFAARRAPVSGTPAPPAAPATPGGGAAAPVQHVVLRLENLTSRHPGPVYDVYLNVPPGSDPKQHEDRFVGRAALFGIAKASRPGGLHGGGGVTVAFDITELYQRLAAAGAIDPQHLRVSFVPVRARNSDKVSVGRISLYFA
jgi:tyrosinase